jgi:hypothetical protein
MFSIREWKKKAKHFTVLRYDLPNNSDLVGQPVSSLSRYNRMVINLWAVHGDAFTECGFLEVTLRVNGIDVFRHSEAFRLVIPNNNRETKFVALSLKEMRLPQ